MRCPLCLLVLFLVACSSAPTLTDAGAPPSLTAYYNLAPEQCFAYGIDGGTPTVGLLIQSVPALPGLALHLSRHGADFRVDYVSLDGGFAYLASQDFIDASGFHSRVYASPMPYLSAPLALGVTGLTGQSSYTDTFVDGGPAVGSEQLTVNAIKQTPYGPDGGEAFVVDFTFALDGGPTTIDQRWAVADAGFVDLFLPDDQGNYQNYLLESVSVASGTSCAAN